MYDKRVLVTSENRSMAARVDGRGRRRERKDRGDDEGVRRKGRKAEVVSGSGLGGCAMR